MNQHQYEKYIKHGIEPVDKYISKDHFEDCQVSSNTCSVDYNQKYQPKKKEIRNVS